eukprot:jgi/Tetstr1/450780/TSEL_037816.t1
MRCPATAYLPPDVCDNKAGNPEEETGMRLDMVALIVVIIFGVLWLGISLAGIVVAMPFGLLALVPIAIGLGLLVVVIQQRLRNKEDDYYDKNVDK